MSMPDPKETVRTHYEEAASNRNKRLKAPDINAARFNHELRLRVIQKLLPRKSTYSRGIDVGTGTGVWAEFLAAYCDHVDGLDFAENNLMIARQNAKEKKLQDRIHYQLDDVETLSSLESENYDVALMISVLQHLPDQAKSLKTVARILRNDGQIILLVHNRRCLFNIALHKARKSGGETSVNQYSSLSDITRLLENADFRIQNRRFVWLFYTDILFARSSGPGSRVLAPIRGLLLRGTYRIDALLSRCSLFNFLYREIVISAIRVAED